MKKEEILKIIDEVMDDKNINSAHNALDAVREKVVKFNDFFEKCTAKLELRGNNELYVTTPYFEGAKYVYIDTYSKLDTGVYGEIRYVTDSDLDFDEDDDLPF